MTPFITYREPDKDGILQYYILQKEFPHMVGVLKTQPDTRKIAWAAVPGYSLWVCFNGTLRGNLVPSYPDIAVQTTFIIMEMANWFREQRINADSKKYKKYKIYENI
jgi:hypothetical protein